MDSKEPLPQGQLPAGQGKTAQDTFETLAPEHSATLPLGATTSEPLSFWTLQPKTPAGGPPPKDGSFPDGSPTAFVLHRMIARGGCGEVWEATQTSMGRSVAVKRMRADVVHRGGATEWEFRQEGVTAAQLEHPNIVPVHDLGRDEAGRPVIAMKLVRGRPWSEVIREDFPLMQQSEFLAKHLPILMATTHAVAFAHSRGIVHRDLKPSQVMTGEFGEVLLMDWGLAIGSHVEGDAAPAFSLPSGETASSPSGTPAYMAPEQTRSKATSVGTWTDIFLLGGILYELLTGLAPHAAETAEVAFRKACSGDITSPRKRVPNLDVPVELEATCLRALAFSPEGRHPSARHFLDDLQDYASGASRRREATALIEEARKHLTGADGSYERLGEAATLAARARQLWPEGTEPRRLEEEATEKQAESALEKGDLVLARLLAGRIATGEKRASLLRAVSEREAEQAGLERQRRFTLGLSFMLLGLLAISFLFYSRRIASERDAAETARGEAAAQRDRAVSALSETEDLVQFMLGDLRTRLAPRDAKLELLDAVAERVGKHYDESMKHGRSLTERRATVRGMSALADVLRMQGRGVEAEKRFMDVRDIARDMEKLEPDESYWRRASGAAAEGIARSRSERGDNESAIGLLKEDLEAARVALARSPKNAVVIGDAMSTASWLAATLDQAGMNDEARAILDEMAGYAKRLVEADPKSAQGRIAMLNGAVNYAMREEREGNPEAAIARIVAAVDEFIAADAPIQQDTSQTLSIAYYRLGHMQMRREKFADAEKSANSASALSRQIVEAHPGDLVAIHDIAVIAGLSARVHIEIGNVEPAREALAEQSKALASLIERDARNVNWLMEAGAATEMQARLEKLRASFDEAAKRTMEARDYYRRVLEIDPTNVKVHRYIAQLDNAEGAAAMQAGRLAEAITKFRSVRDSFRLLGGAPDASASDRFQYSATIANLAAVLEDDGQLSEALELRLEELAIRTEIRDAVKAFDTDRRAFTAASFAGAELSLLAGKPDQALKVNAEAIDYLEEEETLKSPEASRSRRLAQQLVLKARALQALGDSAAAMPIAERAWKMLKPLAEVRVADPYVIDASVWALLVLDRREEAEPLIERLKEPAYGEQLKAELTKRGWVK